MAPLRVGATSRRDGLWQRLPGSGAAWLLALVAALQLGWPVTGSGGAGFALLVVGYLAVALLGVAVPGTGRAATLVVAGSAVAFLAAAAVSRLSPSPGATTLVFASLLPFQASVAASLLRLVFRRRRVTAEVLCAAVTVYLLLAAVFLPLYVLVEAVAPGSFTDTARPGADVAWQQLLHLSLVTLTTLGYGDVVPVSDTARALSDTQAVAGTLYLTVLLARLVALYRGRGSREDGPDEQAP